jgi:hypothetical protein
MVDWAKEDRKQRDKLERASRRGERADVVGTINKMVGQHAAREMPGLGAYGVIRLLQDNGAHARKVRQHNAAFEKMLADGASGKAAERSAGDERYTPKLEADQVRDADGSMDADARTRADHFGGQGVHPIEPEWLTVEQLRVIAGVKALNSRYW